MAPSNPRNGRSRQAAKRPFVVGIAGGSGSGKTTLAVRIAESLGSRCSVVIAHDAYYRSLAGLPARARNKVNFDHPDALETSLLIEHLDRLRSGEAVRIPVYDFTRHVRREETTLIEPRPVIIVEGILIFASEELRSRFDLKVFVDAEDDVRFIRRLERDLSERSRGVKSVVSQYLSTVKPMHAEFVEPSIRYADLLLPGGGETGPGFDVLVGFLRGLAGGSRREGF